MLISGRDFLGAFKKYYTMRPRIQQHWAASWDDGGETATSPLKAPNRHYSDEADRQNVMRREDSDEADQNEDDKKVHTKSCWYSILSIRANVRLLVLCLVSVLLLLMVVGTRRSHAHSGGVEESVGIREPKMWAVLTNKRKMRAYGARLASASGASFVVPFRNFTIEKYVEDATKRFTEALLIVDPTADPRVEMLKARLGPVALPPCLLRKNGTRMLTESYPNCHQFDDFVRAKSASEDLPWGVSKGPTRECTLVIAAGPPRCASTTQEKWAELAVMDHFGYSETGALFFHLEYFRSHWRDFVVAVTKDSVLAAADVEEKRRWQRAFCAQSAFLKSINTTSTTATSTTTSNLLAHATVPPLILMVKTHEYHAALMNVCSNSIVLSTAVRYPRSMLHSTCALNWTESHDGMVEFYTRYEKERERFRSHANMPMLLQYKEDMRAQPQKSYEQLAAFLSAHLPSVTGPARTSLTDASVLGHEANGLLPSGSDDRCLHDAELDRAVQTLLDSTNEVT
jgi:hypothetical protein